MSLAELTTGTVSGRRYLTILFCDLVGSTELSEQLDPEDLQELQQRYHEAALSVIESFGGFVASFSGDGILAYFGYPQARESDPERAVRAGLEVIGSIGRLDMTVRHEPLPPLSVRIGIHTGLVAVGTERSSGGAEDHAVTGEAVNLAARLQNEAPANSIVVSGETLTLIEGLFDTEPLGRKKIRGLKRPVPVHRIIAARTNTDRLRRLSRRGATHMIGRAPCVERIVAAWHRAIDEKRCTIVAITGEAGVGKTRLALETCQLPELSTAALVETHCQEIFAHTPLQPVAGYVWAAAGLVLDDPDEIKCTKISELLRDFGLDEPDHVATIAGLFGLTMPGAPAAAPAPTIQKRRQFDLLVTLIGAIAKRAPTILWIEDAHWLDPSSTELLARIVEGLRDLPILVLMTLRTFPTRPDLPQAHDVLSLAQLAVPECLALARSVPGSNQLSESDLARAVESAEGIPLFVEQLVLSLIDKGGGEGTGRPGLPLSLAELMAERLDRLPSGRRVVQAAGCVGRSFTAGFLARVLDEPEIEVVPTLEALIAAEILRRRPEGSEATYEFRHALLQRMARESITAAGRRALHGRIADLQMEAGDVGPALPEFVAHHLTEASRYGEAIQGWLGAGLRAAQRSAHTESVEHLRRGLALLREIQDPATRRTMELALLAAMIGALSATRGATSQEFCECCERGLSLCKEGEATPLIFPFLFGQFVFAIGRGHTQEAAKVAETFLATAEQAKFDSGRVIGYRLSGMAFLGLGEAARAKEQLERSLALYDVERDAAATHIFGQNTQVHSRSLLSLSLLCLGRIDDALVAGTEALQGADALRHPHSTAIALGYFGGWVLGWLGVPNEMMVQARRLIALADQHQLSMFHAFGTGFLGWAFCQNDDLAQGISVLEQAIGALDTTEYRMSTSGYLAALADAQRRAGKFDAAVKSIERARAVIDAGCDSWLAPEVLRVAALVARDCGKPDPTRAESLAREALAAAQALQNPLFELRCLDALAEIACDERDVASRREALSAYRNLGRHAVSALRRRAPVVVKS